MTRRLVYWPYRVPPRTTEDDMRAIAPDLARGAYTALVKVLEAPERIGTIEVLGGPVRRYSAVGGLVWLYYGAERPRATVAVLHLLLVHWTDKAAGNDPDPDAPTMPPGMDVVASLRWNQRPRLP